MNVFVKRRLNLSIPDAVMAGPLLKAETFHLCLDLEQLKADASAEAENILAQAREQAEVILQDAQQQASVLVAQARQETEHKVWCEANALLESLRGAETRVWAEIETSADLVLHHVLTTLLGDLSLSERLHVVLQQVIQAQRQPCKGTLYCSEQSQAFIDNKLTELHVMDWNVLVKPGLQGDEIELETDTGLFHCSWSGLCNELLPDPAL